MKTTAKKAGQVVARSVAAIGSTGNNAAQGAALATLIIADAYATAKALDNKRLTRRNWVKTMAGFDHAAHLAFREALKAERTKVREEMTTRGYDKNVHRVAGTSAASFFVDVSNYMGISAALETDSSFVFVRDGEHAGEVMAWEDILRHSRIIRKSKASASGTEDNPKKASVTKRSGVKVLRKAQEWALKLDEEQLTQFQAWLAKQVNPKAKNKRDLDNKSRTI